MSVLVLNKKLESISQAISYKFKCRRSNNGLVYRVQVSNLVVMERFQKMLG